MINNYLENEINTIKNLDKNKIQSVIDILDDALQNNKKVYIFGNGGSGSTASHIVCDFNKAEFKNTNKRFQFTCLNDNIPLMLAISNDIAYEDVFYNQLLNRLTKDDIVIGISGSGNSKNIIKAVEYAKKIGAYTVGFTGYDGGKLKKIADITLDSNIKNMQISEDIHLMLEHLMISYFYERYGSIYE